MHFTSLESIIGAKVKAHITHPHVKFKEAITKLKFESASFYYGTLYMMVTKSTFLIEFTQLKHYM